jgi:hypothetical protein
MSGLQTPVAMLVFNRPELTARVFERVREQKPRTLLVNADGPRPGRAGEEERVRAVRAIFDRVDWPCDLRTRFLESNLGCKHGVSSGITWVFSQVERAILLEDDCLPDPTFFRYCEELLEKYAADPRVMMVSGDHMRKLPLDYAASYYFSRIPHIWGWATWRRAWNLYDVEMRAWPEWRDRVGLRSEFGRGLHLSLALWRWQRALERTHRGEIDTWDHQWVFTVLSRGGYCALPRKNLVTNLGFGADATHTIEMTSDALHPTESIDFPLAHPAFIEPEISLRDRLWLHETKGVLSALKKWIRK